MKFFFADSQDFVDPHFDFISEERSLGVRQRRDVYAHELFRVPPYDGVLISKAIVDGNGSASGKYSLAQRNRLLNTGVRGFLRLDERVETQHLLTLGDCGAFSYMREEAPPFSVEEVASFYHHCGFDWAVSVDHVIPAHDPALDEALSFPGVPAEVDRWRQRQKLTLELASEFRRLHRTRRYSFEPIGVAQGWSGASYVDAVRALQRMGYQRIAIGGLVPLRTQDILEVLGAIAAVRKPQTAFHLLGVTRLEYFRTLRSFGVQSFDSTSPLRQAFKDDRDNYYAPRRTYVAVRVPQVDGNPRLKAGILSGRIDGRLARQLERKCLEILQLYDLGKATLKDATQIVLDYAGLYDPNGNRRSDYEDVLGERPWKNCDCDICKAIGINVIMFRGAERNRRRGFHNLHVFYRTLQTEARRRVALTT